MTGPAALLHEAGATGRRLSALPGDLRPRTRAAAYDVQTQVAALTGRQHAGWKIAATSAAGQRHINVTGPLAGRVAADAVRHEGDAVALSGNAMRLAELEFVFVMAADLTPRAAPRSVEELSDAVAALHLGIELPDSRFVDTTTVGDLQLIADNACARDFVLGPRAADAWRDTDLAAVRVDADVAGPGGTRRVEGVGSAVLGHPLAALHWLVDELSGLGLTLAAGELVTTGTCCTPIPVEPGDRVSARFADLGTVTCTFTD